MRINQENTSRTEIMQSSRLVLEITSKQWPKWSLRAFKIPLCPKTRKKGRISAVFVRFISPPGEIVTEFRPRENDRNYETVLVKKQKAVFSRPGIRGTVFLY